ncbi:ORF82c [Capsicum annuum]|nr:ORF82c [Capsicum annuum]
MKGESGPKISPKGVVNGQQVNIPILPLVGLEGRRRLSKLKDSYRFKDVRCPCPFFRVRSGRENASSQCSNTRLYGTEVNHAIVPGKARTNLRKRVPIPETNTERPYEASLFPGIGFGPFLHSLGGRRRRPPFGGPKPSVRYHSEGLEF